MFVVRSGQTSMRFARNALDVLRQRGVRILGLLLNGITPDNPYYYYKNYYYGHYAVETPAGDSAANPAIPAKMAQPKKVLPLPTQLRSMPSPLHDQAPESPLDLPESNQGGAV